MTYERRLAARCLIIAVVTLVLYELVGLRWVKGLLQAANPQVYIWSFVIAFVMLFFLLESGRMRNVAMPLSVLAYALLGHCVAIGAVQLSSVVISDGLYRLTNAIENFGVVEFLIGSNIGAFLLGGWLVASLAVAIERVADPAKRNASRGD